MNIGFIGLGKMGEAMAGNLLRAGHNLTIFNRTRPRTVTLQSAGAMVAETPAQASGGEVTFTCLSDDAALAAVVFGKDGIATALPPGSIHVSLSTISPAMADRLAQFHGNAQQHFIAAPVFGRPDAATAARLLIVAAGDANAIAHCQPLFDLMGGRTIVAGNDPSSALWIKLAGNFLLIAAVESLSEVIALLRCSGADVQPCVNALTSTLFAIPVYQNYARSILEQQHEAGFRLALALKDILLVEDAARQLDVMLPTADLLEKQLQNAILQGWQEKDLSILAQLKIGKERA